MTLVDESIDVVQEDSQETSKQDYLDIGGYGTKGPSTSIANNKDASNSKFANNNLVASTQRESIVPRLTLQL